DVPLGTHTLPRWYAPSKAGRLPTRQKNLLSPRSVIGTVFPEPEERTAAPIPPSTPTPIAVQNHQRCQACDCCFGLLAGGSVIMIGRFRRAPATCGAGLPRRFSSSATFS